MRVGVAAVLQETNTFSPVRTPADAFANGLLLSGPAIATRLAGTNTEVAGFLEDLHASGHEPVPLLAAWAVSGGMLEAAALADLRQRLAGALSKAGRVDALLLALHGATVAEDEEDVSGTLLSMARDTLGQVPLVATLDLHANITRRMIETADALIGYHTCPHVDHAQTGRRACAVLLRLVGGRRAAVAFRKIPMIVPAERMDTSDGPLARMIAMAKAAEAAGAWDVSVFPMQPWLDVPEAGFAAVAIGDDASRMRAVVDAILAEAWAARHDFDVELIPPAEAVKHALGASQKPALLVDSADAMSSGAPGDSTVLLGHLLQAAPEAPVLMTVRDPAVPGEAARAGVGSVLDVMVGGRFAPAFYPPVRLRAMVVALSDGRFRLSAATLRGVEVSMGAAAVLRAGGLHVVVHEQPTLTNDPALYRSLGFEPADVQAIVVKHPIGWRVGLGEMAANAVYVDLPGASSPRLARLPFHRVPRPMYPLDDDAQVEAAIRRSMAPAS